MMLLPLRLLIVALALIGDAASSSSYVSPVPTLTPPKTVHVAIVVGSLNGTLGLSLPCPEKTQNLSAGCERRRRLLTALSSFAGVALRQSWSEGLFMPENTDQLRYLHRLSAARPGLTFKHHANETAWEVMAAMHQQQEGQRLPLQYVQYDLSKNRDSLAAARMAVSNFRSRSSVRSQS